MEYKPIVGDLIIWYSEIGDQYIGIIISEYIKWLYPHCRFEKYSVCTGDIIQKEVGTLIFYKKRRKNVGIILKYPVTPTWSDTSCAFLVKWYDMKYIGVFNSFSQEEVFMKHSIQMVKHDDP